MVPERAVFVNVDPAVFLALRDLQQRYQKPFSQAADTEATAVGHARDQALSKVRRWLAVTLHIDGRAFGWRRERQRRSECIA